jgi:hypothetical protein
MALEMEPPHADRPCIVAVAAAERNMVEAAGPEGVRSQFY